jgi:hypothetical protein
MLWLRLFSGDLKLRSATRRNQSRSSASFDRLVEDLRKAGLPE